MYKKIFLLINFFYIQRNRTMRRRRTETRAKRVQTEHTQPRWRGRERGRLAEGEQIKRYSIAPRSATDPAHDQKT